MEDIPSLYPILHISDYLIEMLNLRSPFSKLTSTFLNYISTSAEDKFGRESDTI